MLPAVEDPLEDPIIRAEVDRAVAPYRATLGKEALEELRNVIAVQLASHPVLSRLVSRLKPPPVVHVSDELPSGGDGDSQDGKAREPTGTGGDD